MRGGQQLKRGEKGKTLKLPNLVGAPYWDPPPKRLAHIVAADSQSSFRIRLLTHGVAPAASVIDIEDIHGRFLILKNSRFLS